MISNTSLSAFSAASGVTGVAVNPPVAPSRNQVAIPPGRAAAPRASDPTAILNHALPRGSLLDLSI